MRSSAPAILHAIFVAVLLVVLTVAFGSGLYHASVPTGATLLRVVVAVLVGAATFCALGLALSAAIPNGDAAAAVVNAVILPVEFLSGIFIPFDDKTPSWILWLARIFPGAPLRPQACRPASSAPPSAGRTSWWWRPGAWPGC